MPDHTHERDHVEKPHTASVDSGGMVGLLAIGSFLGSVALMTFFLVSALGG